MQRKLDINRLARDVDIATHDVIEKQAFLLPLAIGAGTGAALAGKGKGGKGAHYGMIKGILLDVGTGTGMAAGALLGVGLADREGVIPGMIAGGLAGGVGGWMLGTKAAEGATGTKWEDIRKDKDTPKEKPKKKKVEKEAAGGWALLGGALGDIFEGAGHVAGSALEAGATTLDTMADVGRDALEWGAIGAVGTGLAAAYLAYRMKKPRASDIEIDRNNLYIESLKAKIKEVRRKQAVSERLNKLQTNKQPSLRLS